MPQAVQMKAGMRAGYTRVAVDDHFLLVKSAKTSGRAAARCLLRVQTEKNSVRTYVFRFALELGHCSTQSAFLKGANDRDRGEPRGSSPPTPPYVRVRIRRFEKLR